MATWQKVVTESTADTITQKVSNTTLTSAGVVKTSAGGALSSGTISAGNIATNAVAVDKIDIGNSEPANDTSALMWNDTAGEMQWGSVSITVDTSITDGSSNPVTNNAVYDALATKLDASGYTNNRALVSTGGGGVGVSVVTATEIGYLDGVTSSIQTQLNGKQATISTGTTDGDLIEVGEDLSDNDFLRIDGSGVKGLTASQVLSEIGAQASGSYAALAGSTTQNFSTNDLNVTGTLTVTNPVEVNSLTSTEALKVKAAASNHAGIELIADAGQDNADSWQIEATDSSDSNKLRFYNKTSGAWVAKMTLSTGGNLTVPGNLYVGGSTISTETETLSIGDNTLILNGDLGSNPGVTAGFVVERGTTADNATFYFDETSDKWSIGNNADADLGSNAVYSGDVMLNRIDGGYNSNSTEVPVGHFQYDSGSLYLRTL